MVTMVTSPVLLAEHKAEVAKHFDCRPPCHWRTGYSAIYVTDRSQCCCTAVHCRKRGVRKNMQGIWRAGSNWSGGHVRPAGRCLATAGIRQQSVDDDVLRAKLKLVILACGSSHCGQCTPNLVVPGGVTAQFALNM